MAAMRLPRITPFALALALSSAPALAARPIEKALSAWRGEMADLRIEEGDLAIPSTPPPYFAVPALEAFFSTPTAFPTAASEWLDSTENADGLADLHRLGADLLGPATPDLPPAPPMTPARELPPALAQAVAGLAGALVAAKPHLDAARASLTDDERRAFAEMYGWSVGATPAEDELSTRRLRQRLDGLKNYRESEMRAAAALILPALDAALRQVEGQSFRVTKRLRWPTPAGDILIGRSGDDVYRKGDLDGVALLLETGGDNVYETPVAFAGPGEARIAIDLGVNVSVNTSTSAPTAGSSYFGFAAMALPNPAGFKRINTGDYSQGSTIGGVGIFTVAGNCDAYAGRYAQGAAVAGVAIFDGHGSGSRYESTGSGQGAGFVRGAGIFRHNGNDATLRGGLAEPDPRESKGSVSLCQGVGFGRRAFTGGGIGICSLTGDNIFVLASYFAQGSGYWHAAGAFRIHGNGCRVQGRRYDLGAGTHAAFGHFESIGDRTRILNWGVGPSYGWDHAVGSAVIIGDNVEIQADWGTGTASIGSRAFGYIDGQDGKFRLPQFGSGHFFRNESAYSIQVVAGGPHRVQDISPLERAVSGRMLANAWGVARFDDAAFMRNLKLEAPVWPVLERETETRQQAVDLERELKEADTLSPAERVAAIADIAAAFSLDKATPRHALETLVSLSSADVPGIIAALDPAAIDQLIQLSIVVAAHGDDAAAALASVDVAGSTGTLATHLLRLHRPSVVLPELERRLSLGGRRAATAARSLGSLMNRDTGEEPGARAVLESVAAVLDKPKGAARKRALTLLSRVRLTEAFGMLSTAAPIGPEERKRFLKAGPDDITEKIGEGGAEMFLKIVEGMNESKKRMAGEISALEKAEARLRPAFKGLSTSTEAAVVQAAVISAGQVGNAADAAWIAPLLDHPRAAVREAAAVALGRMGDGGTASLLKAAKSTSARTRAMAAIGAGFGTSPSAASVLEASIDDKDPMVVAAALAALRSPTDAFAPAVPSLKKRAARRLNQATGRDLDINTRLLLGP